MRTTLTFDEGDIGGWSKTYLFVIVLANFNLVKHFGTFYHKNSINVYVDML